MNRRILLFLLLGLPAAWLATPLYAQSDRVRTTDGTLTGEVTNTTAVAVTLKKGTASEEVPVNTIRTVVFGREPSELTQSRVNVANGDPQAAIEALEKIDTGEVARDIVKQDIEFYRAFAAAQLALVGDRPIADAGRDLNSFAVQNPQSFHFFEATQLVGDLLVAMGNYPAAAKKYEVLAQAPWESYKMRAAVLQGRALQAEEKHAEALQQFNAVLGYSDTSDEGKQQMLAAKLGKAISLSATGRVEEGVSIIQEVLREADPEDKDLNARAYNALGSCYRQAGMTKDALFAFLHTDLLYASVPSAHAEALFHLTELWQAIGRPTEARRARTQLQDLYANSRWAQR